MKLADFCYCREGSTKNCLFRANRVHPRVNKRSSKFLLSYFNVQRLSFLPFRLWDEKLVLIEEILYKFDSFYLVSSINKLAMFRSDVIKET